MQSSAVTPEKQQQSSATSMVVTTSTSCLRFAGSAALPAGALVWPFVLVPAGGEG